MIWVFCDEFPKKVLVGGGVSSILFLLGFLEFVKLCKAPKLLSHVMSTDLWRRRWPVCWLLPWTCCWWLRAATGSSSCAPGQQLKLKLKSQLAIQTQNTSYSSIYKFKKVAWLPSFVGACVRSFVWTLIRFIQFALGSFYNESVHGNEEQATWINTIP